jgi:hypothetical protein
MYQAGSFTATDPILIIFFIGLLAGEACCWIKGMPAWKSCNLLLSPSTKFFGGNLAIVFLFYRTFLYLGSQEK